MTLNIDPEKNVVVFTILSVDREENGKTVSKDFFAYLLVASDKLNAFKRAYTIAQETETPLDLSYFVKDILHSGPAEEWGSNDKDWFNQRFSKLPLHEVNTDIKEHEGEKPVLRRRGGGLDIC